MHLFFIGQLSRCQFCRPSSCHADTSALVISMHCSHLSMVTGYQVIAQFSDVSKVHKLYVNQSTDPQSEVIVPVERAGEYQVSVFDISGMGILSSSAVYTQQVIVPQFPATTRATTEQHTITSTLCTRKHRYHC